MKPADPKEWALCTDSKHMVNYSYYQSSQWEIWAEFQANRNCRLNQGLQSCVPDGTTCLLSPGLKCQLDWELIAQWSSELRAPHCDLRNRKKDGELTGSWAPRLCFPSPKLLEVSFGPTTNTKSVHDKNSTK